MFELIQKKGFTLIELSTTIGIFLILFCLAAVSFFNLQKAGLLKDNLWQIAATLRQAQNRTASASSINEIHLRYGILFTSTSYDEFATTTNYLDRQQDADLQITLPSSLSFTNLNLPDNCLQAHDCIIFSTLNGIPSAAGSVTLKNNLDQEQKTISINNEGKINF